MTDLIMLLDWCVANQLASLGWAVFLVCFAGALRGGRFS
jgi:hypothetical protein